jgi:hypothetical protein
MKLGNNHETVLFSGYYWLHRTIFWIRNINTIVESHLVPGREEKKTRSWDPIVKLTKEG